MTINVLFDEKRREQLRHAIKKGEPIRLRSRKPDADGIIRGDFGNENLRFDTGGYNVKFTGVTPEGDAIVDIIGPENNVVRRANVPFGTEHIMERDGKKITITPTKISTGNICTINVEDKKDK